MTVLRSLVLVMCVLVLATTATRAQSLAVIRAAGIGDDDLTAIVYAIRSGAFRRAGLDVQLQMLPNGPAITSAVIGGSLEIGKSGTLSLINAHDRGVPITLVAPSNIYDQHAPNSLMVVAADSPIRTPKDLDGKTIAVSSLKGLEQVIISGWVDARGGDSKSLHFLELPIVAMRAAIEEHRADSGIMTYPGLADALAAGRVRVLGPAMESISTRYLISSWFSTIDWARAHPDQVAAFARTLGESAAYVNAHHDETASMMGDFLSVPAARIQSMPRAVFPPGLTVADLQPVINAAYKYQTISKLFPASELIFAK